MCDDIETLETSRQSLPTIGESIASSEDSLVRTFLKQVGGSVSRGDVRACGLNSFESFASYDLESSSWKTSQTCLFGGWEEFSENWPQAGSMQNGQCFLRALWVHHIHGRECFLWPTPRASGRDNCGGSHARAKAKREGTYLGRKANPAFLENLMGFPPGWSDLQPSETQFVRPSPNSSPAAS